MAEHDLSWVQTLAEEHAHLEALLARVDGLLAGGDDGPTREALLPLLQELADRCRRHMELEESGGYLPEVRNRLPNLAGTLDRLQGEHTTLQRELSETLASARAAPSSKVLGDAVLGRLRQWVAQIRNHEMRENRLVQEVLNTDLGGGD